MSGVLGALIVRCIAAFGVMLIQGAMFARHNLYTISFWESLGALLIISLVWMGSIGIVMGIHQAEGNIRNGRK